MREALKEDGLTQEVRDSVGISDSSSDKIEFNSDHLRQIEILGVRFLKNVKLHPALDERLKTLVVDPIDALPEGKRTVRGRVRTGEEIARAIPDQAAFLREIDQLKEGKFFELNEKGQLVMQDGCTEAYGLKDTFPMAQKRQKRLVYRDKDGKIQVLANTNFTVDKATEDRVLPDTKERIAASSILMERGLPTLIFFDQDGHWHSGEYNRIMNDKNQFDRHTYSWTDDESLHFSIGRFGGWGLWL
ncbi:MAG: hypothetical protein ACD_28C00025G0001 [uncultured bacterium]|nr:MAG: hypothetical protein ACD_28C00025G0001 [uncultured bacterium]KKT73720.1 MAG: hypothetical protein UW70_C0077G0001 [Candidatus Peregrinibacteria bacterium GW2011_GWA2_44_7]